MVSLVLIRHNYSGVTKKIPVKNCNFHSNCFTWQCGCISKVQWIHCIPLDSEKCQD